MPVGEALMAMSIVLSAGTAVEDGDVRIEPRKVRQQSPMAHLIAFDDRQRRRTFLRNRMGDRRARAAGADDEHVASREC